jgi:hypothetical protein
MIAIVTNVRRIAMIVVLLVAATTPLFMATPAAAHFCAFPVSVEPGKAGSVNIGVAAEATSIVDVSITIPPQFRLHTAVDERGWTQTHDAASVHYAGGPIQPYTCAYFSLIGVADHKQTLTFPLSVTDNHGTVFPYVSKTFGDPYAAQLVYVRPERHEPAGVPPAEGSQSGVPIAGIALAAVVIAGLPVANAVRRRRSRVRRSRVSPSTSSEHPPQQTGSLRH